MESSTLIFIGAGFSVEANIPVQNHILSEMQREPNLLSGDNTPESVKFLESFIDVGIFILNKFTNFDINELIKKKEAAKFIKAWEDVLLELQSEISTQSLQSLAIKFKEPNIVDLLNEIIHISQDKILRLQLNEITNAHYYRILVDLKEQIRKALSTENPKVDLEDIFTIFDKSFRENENWGELTYVELDHLRHALLRLFTYYFGQKIYQFSKSKTKAYDSFVQYVRENSVSIITTNWDSITEIILKKNNIDFKTHEEKNYSENYINIIKLHGSINWFKCNSCGTYQIAKYCDIATHLLDDKKKEKCEKCQNFAVSNQVVLQPEIITPTMLKTLNSKLYREIWTSGSSAIEKANKIIFIGYSLPQADFEIRYLLKKHIKRDALIDVVLIAHDKPKSTSNGLCPEDRYKSLFPANKISFHYEGYKKFFRGENQRNC
jgi:NAD-dependent SIR2 family protein deacetylase